MKPTIIIAEAGVNHNGSLDLALKLVDVAADAGADIVKFQTFDAKALVTAGAMRAQYQVDNIGEDGSQLEMLQALSLDEASHVAIADHCQARNIAFMSTAFDFWSFEFLKRFDMPYIKIPSGDLTFGPMLRAAGESGRRVILSTGMGNLDEIHDALAVLAYGRLNPGQPANLAAMREHLASNAARAALRDFVTVLHCVTQYPCPAAYANLAAMETIRDTFELPVGYSDHTLGIAVPIAAVARGACMIEKHVTLDRTMAGPDHAASLEPDQFAEMVAAIHDVEVAIGDGLKLANPVEIHNIAVARRSLVAARPIRVGEPLVADMLTAKRPGTGLSPMQYWDVQGQPAHRNYAIDEMIE
ncbi:N-acetylneuraminate synthase [Altererythrobacter rubellus]|uniref:N-acetylneuraminate synthase n=1 Tax=Altererythrobacter rubellus TaxID=2173831 RepID=A0A9Y2F2K3_9SPHN|nr:N-acetylneuraminate synthase [Altererythrobacter rubellus]WIW95934.1 N-acetylneuraminate synthase [Altererythrobacter rubellus]